jgi:hypothetical protein
MLRKVDSIRRDVVDLGLHEHTQTAELMPRLEAAMYRLETRLGRTPVCVVHLSSTHRRAQTTFHGVVRSGVLRVGQKIRNSTRVVAVSADEAWPGERVEFAVDHEIVLPNELVFLV